MGSLPFVLKPQMTEEFSREGAKAQRNEQAEVTHLRGFAPSRENFSEINTTGGEPQNVGAKKTTQRREDAKKKTNRKSDIEARVFSSLRPCVFALTRLTAVVLRLDWFIRRKQELTDEFMETTNASVIRRLLKFVGQFHS